MLSILEGFPHCVEFIIDNMLFDNSHKNNNILDYNSRQLQIILSYTNNNYNVRHFYTLTILYFQITINICSQFSMVEIS